MRLKAYANVFTITWQHMMEVRMSIVIQFLISAISLLSVFYLWSSIYGDRTELSGFTFVQLITYYVFMNVLLASFETAYNSTAEDIHDGTLSRYLSLPHNYIVHMYAQYLAHVSIRVILSVPILIGIMFLLKNYIFLPRNPLLYLFLVISFFFAITISFFIETLMGFLEFWFTNSWGFQWFYHVTRSFFVGHFVPFAFFPLWLLPIANVLPFKYIGAFVVEGFMGMYDIQTILFGLGVQLVWLITLAIAVRVTWLRGLKRYEAYGN